MDKLEKKLRKIADDDDFVQGVFGFAKTKEDRKRVLEYINNGIDVSYENILLLSLDLNLRSKSREFDE